MELTFRPRLTRGAHLTSTDETGDFCLVEAVGFNADRTVSDHHSSVDVVLAAMARSLNDRMCDHLPTPAICGDCQARLWAIGPRIAGTGNVDLSAQDRARLHVGLAITAAQTVLRAIEAPSTLHTLAEAAVEAATICVAEPTVQDLFTARTAAAELESYPFADQGQVWAADACAKAASVAVRYASALTAFEPDKHLDNITRHAVDVVAYATFATAGDPPASMRLARRVLNAFGKATSQNETPGVSLECACDCSCTNPAELVKLHADGPKESDVKCYACNNDMCHVEPDDAVAAAPMSWAEAVAADQLDAAVAAELAAPIPEAYTPMGNRAAYLAAACEAAPSWAECEEAYNARPAYSGGTYIGGTVAHQAAAIVADASDDDDVAELWDAKASHMEAGAEDNEDVNDFDESELGDVADEAISELELAERMLNAIAQEHRAVEAWVRKGADGTPTEYRQKCCVSCRNAVGQPVPAPCRTMRIIEGYGE